jgi:choice-of-anchor B domain-containing protein
VSGAGLSVIDLDGPSPVEVGFVPTAVGAGDTKDVEAHGRYAYVVNEFGPIQIVDLQDPAAPVQVGLLNTQPGVVNGGTHTLSIADGHLYAQGGRDPGGVRIYSLADPVSPALVGSYQPHYFHDVYVRGTTMYAAAIYGQGVDVVDLATRASPQLISRFNYPASGAHNVCMTEDGTHIFVGDEIGAGPWTRVFNVEDPEDVTLVAEIVVNAAAVSHNCNVLGDLLYLAHYTEGVRVFDVSDPVHPVEVAFYDTHPAPGSGYNGNWSVYPYLPSGRLIASDLQQGLFVLRLDGAVAGEPGPGAARPLALRAAPNPWRERARLSFALPEAADVRLAVYDVLGREVAVLREGALAAGAHEATLEAGGLPEGLYLVRLRAGARSAVLPLTLAR